MTYTKTGSRSYRRLSMTGTDWRRPRSKERIGSRIGRSRIGRSLSLSPGLPVGCIRFALGEESGIVQRRRVVLLEGL